MAQAAEAARKVRNKKPGAKDHNETLAAVGRQSHRLSELWFLGRHRHGGWVVRARAYSLVVRATLVVRAGAYELAEARFTGRQRHRFCRRQSHGILVVTAMIDWLSELWFQAVGLQKCLNCKDSYVGSL